MESVVIRGVSLDKNQAKITLAAVARSAGCRRPHFKALARRRSTSI